MQQDDPNADALNVLDGALSVAERKMIAAHVATRQAFKDRGVPRCGAAIKAIGRDVGTALDPILDVALPKAWNLVAEPTSALKAFEERIAAFIAKGHAAVMTYTSFAAGTSPAAHKKARALLDGDRARVLAILADMRRESAPASFAPVSAGEGLVDLGAIDHDVAESITAQAASAQAVRACRIWLTELYAEEKAGLPSRDQAKGIAFEMWPVGRISGRQFLGIWQDLSKHRPWMSKRGAKPKTANKI